MATLTNLYKPVHSFDVSKVGVYGMTFRKLQGFAFGLVYAVIGMESKTHAQFLAKYLPPHLRSKITVT